MTIRNPTGVRLDLRHTNEIKTWLSSRLLPGGTPPSTPATPHNILSATHPNTLPGAITRGDLLYGNATPLLARLPLGGIAGSVVTRDATDVLWSAFALAGTAAQTYTFPAGSGGVATGAGTLTVATGNDATIVNHTHAITSSSNPGAAASILASAATGYLQLTGLGINSAPLAVGNVVIQATQDASLSAEYITATADRNFSAATNWAGANWLIPLSAALVDVTVSAANKTFTRVAGSFITDGFQVGMSVTWTGFAKIGTLNNGTFVITTQTALVMTCAAATLTDEVPADYVSVTATSPVFSHAVAGANAATLANVNLTAPPVAGDIFQITITVVTRTANTLTVSIGGVAMASVIGKEAGTLTAYVFNIAVTGAGVLTVTPGATWLGWFDNISVKLVAPASSILTGKLAGGTTVLETRMPNSASLGVGLGALQGSVQLYSNGFGYAALQYNTGAYSNGFGGGALRYNTGVGSSGFGDAALYNNTGAYSNGFGYAALQNNIGMTSNGFGYFALQNNIGMSSNGFGYAALRYNIGANSNGFGHNVLYENTTGTGSVAFGHNAGRGYTDNNYCVFLGYDTRTSIGTLTNSIVIGANARGSKSNQVTLGHTDVVETILRGSVLVGTITNVARNLYVATANAVTAAVTYVSRRSHTTSGVAAALFGVGHEDELEDDAGNPQVVSEQVTLWAAATSGAESPLYRVTTYPAGTAGPGYSGHWTWAAVDGTARTVIPNGAGDVTGILEVLFAIVESAGGIAGGEIAVNPGGVAVLYFDGVDTLTLSVAADGSATVQRTAGAATFKVSLWMTWI